MTLGVRQFFAWVEQAHREITANEPSEHSWRGAEHDPRWHAMREARDRARGYELRPAG